MAKSSRYEERRRQKLLAAGLKPLTVRAPEEAHASLREVVRLVRDGLPVDQALRRVGQSNLPDDVLEQLDLARSRTAELEAEIEAVRDRMADVTVQAVELRAVVSRLDQDIQRQDQRLDEIQRERDRAIRERIEAQEEIRKSKERSKIRKIFDAVFG
jgi:predicted RNase H-like nuclease (RuvC/YqgF family)